MTITRTLVKQHGGQIQVAEHAVGKTAFVLHFPDADDVQNVAQEAA